MATIMVSGASGFIGSELVLLLRDHHQVLRLVRRAAVHPDEVGWDFDRGHVNLSACEAVDVIINLSGAPIGRRWTSNYREQLLRSRVEATRTLARTAVDLGPQVALINASSVGIYGDRGEEALTENSSAGTGFLAELVQQWEQATELAQLAGNRVVLARTGIVMSASGGALAVLMPFLRRGLAGPLGTGKQIWPWISLRDQVHALGWLAEHDIDGPVNLWPLRSARPMPN